MSDALAKPLPRAILRVSDDPLRTAFPFQEQSIATVTRVPVGFTVHCSQERMARMPQPKYTSRNSRRRGTNGGKIDIFRDQTDLSLTPHVWPTIEEALLDSEYFLLLASPAASHSQWVAREN